jgi:hypothetical protein
VRDTELDLETLQAAVEGDFQAFESLQRRSHVELRNHSESQEFTLTSVALRQVLQKLLEEQITPDDVQKWASFVRRGYIAGRTESPVIPIDIAYDPRAEEEVADVISRLDEIGDSVDGEIDDDELRRMIAGLPA